MQLLYTDVTSHGSEFVLVDETWYTDKQADAEISLPGFNLFRLDRKGRNGGGVCIYVLSKYSNCKIIQPTPLLNHLEILWLSCIINNIQYFIACCYHPPKPIYDPDLFKHQIAADVGSVIASCDNAIILLAGDFNSLDLSFLEVQFGLSQIVSDVTHGNNILDKVYVNRPDLYCTMVVRSLLKTKHCAVLVHPNDKPICLPTAVPKRRKVEFHDLRQCNIDKLRWSLGTFDWAPLLACSNVKDMYTFFLQIVRCHIVCCVPIRTVTLGPRDPDFVTPLIKALLNKRRKLRRSGQREAADELATRINGLICEFRKSRLSHMADASPKELWRAVRAKGNSRSLQADDNLKHPDLVNNYFAGIATDNEYDKSNVHKFCVDLDTDCYKLHNIHDYQVELLLRKIKPTSSGYDDLPSWIFKQCSYELAGIISEIFNRSFRTGTVPVEWLTAVVTPVPKKPCPSGLVDYRPISVTPILSRVAEKLVVREWLRPSIPKYLLNDQFGFRPSGSTTSALVHFMHHATLMLENNAYVRCLLVDFSKAFDVVKHNILLSKLSALDIPPCVLNWIISFLTDRSQVCKTAEGHFSTLHPITRSIIQGSGIGPTLWIIMESDLQALSTVNLLFKYADDTNLLVPENTDVSLGEEFSHLKDWAQDNGMIINLSKTKELVLHRPHPNKFSLPQSLEGIERVHTVKLLGVIFDSRINFVNHVDTVLKTCSQRIFLLKQLRDQGLPLRQLHLIFQAIILNRILYAAPAWAPFLNVEMQNKIDAFLKRSFRYGFATKIFELKPLLDTAMYELFKKMKNPDHCLFQLLPEQRKIPNNLRLRGHDFVLPEFHYKLHKLSFVTNCLYRFLK